MRRTPESKLWLPCHDMPHRDVITRVIGASAVTVPAGAGNGGRASSAIRRAPRIGRSAYRPLREVGIDVRRVVWRLVAVGVVVTWVAGAIAAALLFSGIDRGVAVLLGAIVVVSGPTVVLPLRTLRQPSSSETLLMTYSSPRCSYSNMSSSRIRSSVR